MTLTTTVELLIRPEFSDAYLARLATVLPETRAAQGCIDVAVYRDQGDRSRIIVIEHWDSRADYDLYIEWRRSTGAFDKLAPILERPMTVQFLDAVA